MSTPAHTPGPWTIETWQIGEPKTPQLVVRGPADAIAYVQTLWVPQSREHEMQANARLIAAAPDMLAALQEMVAHVATIEKQWNEDGREIDTKMHGLAVSLNNRAGDLIRAAIDKATTPNL